MKTVIRHGLVVDENFREFLPLDIVIRDGIIEDLVPRGAFLEDIDEEIHASGQYVIPGLVDIHNHGGLGIHFAEDQDFTKPLMLCASQGVTTVLATVGVRPVDEILGAVNRILSEQKKDRGARMGGIHMEGPFVSSGKRGAMPTADVPCNLENFRRILEASQGQLRVMTIAPERENALDVIRCGVRSGVRMSLGHTMATYEEALAAIEAGATGSTHTFNAMPGLLHREPGVLGAVLTKDQVTCEVICDMVHLAPATVQLIVGAKGSDRVIMVSDSVKITCLGDGDYPQDGIMRYVRNGVSRLENGTIAGSTCTLADDARKMISLGYSLLDIARMASYNPAQAVGLTDRGAIARGKLADLIITDGDMHISKVILRGRSVNKEG